MVGKISLPDPIDQVLVNDVIEVRSYVLTPAQNCSASVLSSRAMVLASPWDRTVRTSSK